MPVTWKQEYALGIGEIDVQHQALLDILGRVNRAAQKGTAKEVMWQVYAELNEYAAYHFLTEERLMHEHAPVEPATARHIVQHRNYWVTLSDFKKRFADDDGAVTGELVAFLNAWWIEHIQGTDRQMADNLRPRGVR